MADAVTISSPAVLCDATCTYDDVSAVTAYNPDAVAAATAVPAAAAAGTASSRFLDVNTGHSLHYVCTRRWL